MLFIAGILPWDNEYLVAFYRVKVRLGSGFGPQHTGTSREGACDTSHSRPISSRHRLPSDARGLGHLKQYLLFILSGIYIVRPNPYQTIIHHTYRTYHRAYHLIYNYDLDFSGKIFLICTIPHIAHVAGSEPYDLHDLRHVSWVRSVTHRSCTIYHTGRSGSR